MSTRPLTTTSYAILGVLATRAWSAYDLTGYMRTSAVRNCWPRTESRLYAEPKNLVAHGLAEASKEYTGRRRRTVYRITDEGRRALAGWLGERATRWSTEDEALLKIILCDHGSREQLLETIRWAMEDLRDAIAVVGEIGARILKGEGRFPERIHATALSARNGIGTLRHRFEYLSWAREWVRSWDGTGLDDAKREVAMGVMRETQSELERLDADLRRALGTA